MKEYLPYIVTIISSLITGLTSYAVSRKKSKDDLIQIQKKFELDLEKEREKFELEKEKLEIEHKNQIDLMNQRASSEVAKDMMSTLLQEAFNNPEVKKQFQKGVSEGLKK